MIDFKNKSKQVNTKATFTTYNSTCRHCKGMSTYIFEKEYKVKFCMHCGAKI